MDVLITLLLMFLSLIIGVVTTILVQWYLFNAWIMHKPVVGPPEKPVSSQFCLPQNLIEALQSSDVPKKESCLALNLLFQFLFKELRNTEKVRQWFLRKLSQEFDELLTRTTTGKLFDKVTIRDLHLGKQFPAIKSITVKDVVIDSEYQHIDCLDLCLDLEYSGGFQLSIDANMLLGKAAFLAVKVNHLSGLGRLQFTRHPYTHWSFTFYNEPVLELQVESQFQGRQFSHITSLIASQIRKAVKKKHTLPNYKLRYKPFFTLSEPGEEDSSYHPVNPGTLEVTVVELTRLMGSLTSGDIYCSLAVDSTAWVEMVQSETSSFMTLDLIIAKPPGQQLGIVFKQEFIAERYAACVVVETVVPQSPASSADVRRGDILLAVDGKKVTSMSQTARVIKGAGDKFTLRVERKSNYKLQSDESNVEKEGIEKDIDFMPGGSGDLRLDNMDGLRQRHGSFGEKTESDSSNSNPASVPGSPARNPVGPPRSSQSSPEHLRTNISHQNSFTSVDGDGEDSDYLQIHKTKPLSYNQIIPFKEPLTFRLQAKHRYLNVSVWSKVATADGEAKPRSERDKLVGHVSIPLGSVTTQCTTSTLGHHIKSYNLLPPDSQTDINRSHKLWGHSGFEPCLCYGDILLSFLYSSSRNSSAEALVTTPLEPVQPPQLLQPSPPDPQEPGGNQHDFIRTHFHRTTQCDFCGKKIWLKDAVQCRDCAMTCHKKCVSKCQQSTVCGAIRRLSAPPFESLSVDSSPRRVSIQPEIITTAATEDGAVTPQASLVGNPFQFAHTVMEGDTADEVSVVLDRLLQNPNDEDLMSVAKSTGKDLYASLPLPERKEKINAMITKLKSAIDEETSSRMSLARDEQATKVPTQRAKQAFLIGKSDEKVQALAVLMLHFCSGLQHIQDQEDLLNKKSEIGAAEDEDLSIEVSHNVPVPGSKSATT